MTSPPISPYCFASLIVKVIYQQTCLYFPSVRIYFLVCSELCTLIANLLQTPNLVFASMSHVQSAENTQRLAWSQLPVVMIPTLDGCNTRTITTNIQHYCRNKQHLHYHHCTTRKLCTRNSMRLASYLGQLTTCMRPYESKHPTSSNSLEIGCGKSEVRLQFPFF